MSFTTNYTITGDTNTGFTILADGTPLTTTRGTVRTFSTRSSARKAVSRLRRGVTR